MASKAQTVAPPPKRSRNSLRLAAAALVAIAVVAAGWALWRRQIVVSNLPPVLSTSNSELAERIAVAESEAHSFLHPVRGLIALSQLYHANGAYDQALQCYTCLRRLQPREPKWPHLEANLMALYGRMEDAIPREARAVALAPDYVPARLRLANEYQKSGRWKEARATFNDVLARAKDNPYALLGIALCDIQDGNWDGASDTLRHAIDTNPEFVGAMSLMVTVYDHYGDSEHAEALRQTIGRREFIDLEDPWLDRLMDECYDAYRISVAAAVQNFAGHTDVAEALLRRAVALEPQAATYHRQLGNLLFKNSRLAEAKPQFETAVQLQPSDADAWLLLYQVEQSMQDMAAASQTLTLALANCPNSASLHLERAHLLRALGRVDEEAAELHASYIADTRDARPLEELALLYLSHNRVDDAMAELKEALLRQPDDPHAMGMMTYCYIKLGDEASATRWWTDHVLRQPRTPASLKQSLRQAYQQKFGHALP